MESALEYLEHSLQTIQSLVWGEFMLVLILGTGLFLMLRLKGMPLRNVGPGFRQLARGRKPQGKGDISSFNALMTALSATIGTGNIVGVATAIGIGGPGALFWMWCSALVGMATKYAEAVCAVHYRETDAQGRHVGGPMYYIKNGLGKRWAWLGVMFAVFGTLAGFGIGNTVQANSVADALQGSFGLSPWITSVVLMLLVGIVLIGGVRRLANVAGKLVPFMATAYLLAGFLILLLHIPDIPAAVALVVSSAFTGSAAQGGFAGATVMMAIQFGVARGVFSNEAGLGSAPIAHAAAKTDSPVRQGLIAMLGTFIDTLVVCTVTGLVLIVTGAWSGGAQGASMSQEAFAGVILYGDVLISICLALFAFTTLLGWSYYGERCAQYLMGERVVVPFRVVWLLAIPVGANMSLGLVWISADILNGLMALPNLIALICLSGVVVALTREYFTAERSEPLGL
ncbi:sodium:alanine symporter family protein [Marinimicrobium sp. ABcell2]|uniref:alanine/glycine:cation symporter family protein n=1 Tax=Marinimicrobium sp. ABcell2 TaxID=3069751 RepID=UPI0027B2E141|nr:sodium:alanine symporter family protein [Marinimicrobium sp. ABcell2]MDQ2075661.1 sodium:alanine symporter family protein [Marinimicrobium sp. ABcell2]